MLTSPARLWRPAPGRARAPRGNCRLFDTARRNPARDGLSAGGEWIRTSGTRAREVGCRAPKNRAGRIAAAQLADLVLVRCRSAGTLALAPGRCPGAARRPGVGGFGDGGWALAHARTGAAGF